jgi:steroid delta-isomerase-like uncharacterized protein
VRIAVVGGTGLVGRYVVEALERAGHEAVVVARSRGIDVATGAGLAAALEDVEAVVDATNIPGADAEEARAFFERAGRALLAAERDAGVRHHVVLSIVGLERVPGNAHYAGKLVQEEVARGGDVPVTIVRATQFHEYAEMMIDWTLRDGVAYVPPLLVQPAAASDVAAILAEVAAGEPGQGTIEVAGPRREDLFDMARQTIEARAGALRVEPSWSGWEAQSGEVLLPGPDARLTPTTFDEWVAGEAVGDRLVRRFYDEFWNEWRLELAAELLAEDIRFRGSFGTMLEGRAAVLEYAGATRAAFPDWHNRVDELWSAGDRVVARLTWSGTHTGPFRGVQATGNRVSYTGVALFRIADGRIAEAWIVGDTQELWRSLDKLAPGQ